MSNSQLTELVVPKYGQKAITFSVTTIKLRLKAEGVSGKDLRIQAEAEFRAQRDAFNGVHGIATGRGFVPDSVSTRTLKNGTEVMTLRLVKKPETPEEKELRELKAELAKLRAERERAAIAAALPATSSVGAGIIVDGELA